MGNFRRQRFLPCGREHFVEDAKKIRVVSPEGEIRMGVYRADYFDDAGERVIWSSWIVPDAAEPDFHIPSSLGILKLENFVPLSRLK